MTNMESKIAKSPNQPRNDLTADYVRSILNYDHENGILWHKPRPIRPDHARHDKIWNERYATPKLRRSRKGSYLHIKIDGVLYRSHRIAWLYYYGVWPTTLIDHENGVRDDIRIKNLREATFSNNTMNSTKRSDNASGFKGVDYMAKKGLWRARVGISGKNIFLGLFQTPEDAHEAYKAASRELHKEFARAG